MSVPMAIVDFIPVFLFLAASVILQRDLYNKMSKGAFALFSAGTIVVFVAGCFKAIWKLLYALGICDFEALNKSFFPMQTTGFILSALGIIALLCYNQKEKAIYSAAIPVVYTSKMIFVILMVLGVFCLDGALVLIAMRRKKITAMILYIISFVFIMGMGYLSSKDFANPMMNWIGECVNIVGQGTFLWGTWILHKNGLADENALMKSSV